MLGARSSLPLLPASAASFARADSTSTRINTGAERQEISLGRPAMHAGRSDEQRSPGPAPRRADTSPVSRAAGNHRRRFDDRRPNLPGKRRDGSRSSYPIIGGYRSSASSTLGCVVAILDWALVAARLTAPCNTPSDACCRRILVRR